MSVSSCAFTGHRPDRFCFKYDEDDERCVKLKALMQEQIGDLIVGGVNEFFTGMALGVDQWAAEIVLDFKKNHPDIKLTAVLPCETQADSWSEEQRERYFNTLPLCDDVVTLHKHYTRSCMFERNRYLVDHAEFLLAVFDGGEKGGTAYTIKYGKQKGRKVIVIHPDSLEASQS